MIDPTETAVSAEKRARIRARLDAVARDHDVRILLAVESGSRAWGFASPDSDYDVRFVYVHKRDWYLSLGDRRDVIEYPLDADDLDVAGWDLRKALRLLLKSNPALSEWLRSPIVYGGDPEVAAEMRRLAREGYALDALASAYASIAYTTWRDHFDGHDEVRHKRYLYVLRSLIAMRWIAERLEPPPMDMEALLAGVALPADAAAALADLLARKRIAKEKDEAPRLPALDAWIEERLAESKALAAALPRRAPKAEEAEALFRRIALAEI